MAARIHRVIMLPWDSPAGDGIHAGVLPESGFTSGERFRMGKRSAYGCYARVKAWQLLGHMSVTSTGGGDSAEGDLSLVCVAVDYTDVPLGDEGDIAKHGGWYGEAASAGDWTNTLGDPYDPGFISLRFGNETGVVDSAVTLGPVLVFTPLAGSGDGVALRFGENGVDVAATVSIDLPITNGGFFDGYSEDTTHFTLKIGAPVGYDVVGTFMTFNPVVFWKYNTLDGDGDVYDEDDGSWLRTPPTTE